MNNKSTKIKEFIYTQLQDHPGDIISIVSKEFGFSRQSAHEYIEKEVKENKIVKIGRTRAMRYFLIGGKIIEFSVKIRQGLAEDQVWSQYVKPMLFKL